MRFGLEGMRLKIENKIRFIHPPFYSLDLLFWETFFSGSPAKT